MQNTFAIIFAQPYSVCMQESMQFWNLETIKILFCKKCLTKKVFNASKLEILGHLLGAGGPDLGKILSLKFGSFLSKLAPKDRTLRVGPGKICLTWPKGGLMVRAGGCDKEIFKCPMNGSFWPGSPSTQYMSHQTGSSTNVEI